MEKDIQGFDYFKYRRQIRAGLWVTVVTLIIIVTLLIRYNNQITACMDHGLVPVPDDSWRGFGCISQEEYKKQNDNTNSISGPVDWRIDGVIPAT